MVSAGCARCYAQTMAGRMSNPGMWGHLYAVRTPNGARWTGKVDLIPEKLAEPLHIRKPSWIFVNSTSDLFHEELPFEAIAAVWGVMAACPQHTFIVLTKRPERAAEFFPWLGNTDHTVETLGRIAASVSGNDLCDLSDGRAWPLSNVILGTSVEDMPSAERRIPHLLDCPAACHLISAEPLLGPIDLENLTLMAPVPPYGPGAYLDALRGHIKGPDDMLPARIGWVITGGESGHGARPMHPAWPLALRDQCVAAGVPFFFKQWGEFTPIDQPWKQENPKPASAREQYINLAGGSGYHGEEVWRVRRVGKHASGRELDGLEWSELPLLPPVQPAAEEANQ